MWLLLYSCKRCLRVICTRSVRHQERLWNQCGNSAICRWTSVTTQIAFKMCIIYAFNDKSTMLCFWTYCDETTLLDKNYSILWSTCTFEVKKCILWIRCFDVIQTIISTIVRVSHNQWIKWHVTVTITVYYSIYSYKSITFYNKNR